jgi:phospholipid/cholesterol/gamma-HCH transport system substrate-binding protein
MIGKAQRIRVGVFVVISALLLAILVIAFGGLRFWNPRDRYQIVFASSVYGLAQGAKVYRNGIPVGTVVSMAVPADAPDKIRVEIALDRGTPIHRDTRATLQFAGITGLKEIDLRGGSLGTPLVESGGTIEPGEGTFDRIERQASALLDESTALFARSNQMLDYLVAASKTLGDLVADSRAALHRSLASIDAAARSAERVIDGPAAQAASNVRDVAARLNNVVDTSETTLRATLFDLRQASRSFKEFARELRQRPSRLLLSKPEPDRKLP